MPQEQPAPAPLLNQPKQARSRQTVTSILEAAAELFTTQGYDNTSTSDIATRAGKPVGSVYTYFKDKRQILLALWDLLYREEAEAALAELTVTDGVDVRTAISKAVTRLFERQMLYRKLSPTIAYLATQDAEVGARVRELNQVALARLQEFLQAIHERGLGYIPDPEAAALVVQVAAETLAGMGLPYTGHISRRRVETALTDMISCFISADAGSSAKPR